MKKLIKTSILAILFLALLTVVSHAANKSASVDYGEINSDGSMLITVTFPDDRDTSNSAYDGLFSNLTSDGWTVSSNRETITKTVTGVNTEPYMKYYSGGPVDDGVVIKVATPFTMNVGNTYTFTSSDTTVTGSSNRTAVSYTASSITAESAGSSTITISSTAIGGTNYTMDWLITVAANGTGTGTGTGTSSFSNAEYSYDNSKGLIIKNVAPTENTLYCIIDFESSSDYSSESARTLSYSNEGNYYYVDLNNAFGDKIMQDKDTYIHIFERTYNSGAPIDTKIAEQKLEKPDLSTLNKFSDASMATYDCTQLLLNGLPTYLQGNDYGLAARKVYFKIGQITDSSILSAIKNGDASGFSGLLTYAKNATNPVIEKTETANNFRGYVTYDELAPGSSFIDGAYYYLYMVVDDEDGKYLPIESITIAQADVFPTVEDYPWYLFFYGTDDFNFDNITDDSSSSSEEPQEEILPAKLAKTGEGTILIAVIGVLTVLIFVIRRKNKKYGNF